MEGVLNCRIQQWKFRTDTILSVAMKGRNLGMVRRGRLVLDFDFQDNFPTPETGIAEISEVAGEKARMFGRAVREGTVHELHFDAVNAARGSEDDDPRENDKGREEAVQRPAPNEPQAHVAVEEAGLPFPVQETGETDGIFLPE